MRIEGPVDLVSSIHSTFLRAQLKKRRFKLKCTRRGGGGTWSDEVVGQTIDIVVVSENSKNKKGRQTDELSAALKTQLGEKNWTSPH